MNTPDVNDSTGRAAAGCAPVSGYSALERAERYPELKHIDADLLDEWRAQWGTDPDYWNVRGVCEIQLARNMRELCAALRHNAEVIEVAVADSTKTRGVRPPLSPD